jgi:hypothetical protein
MRKKKRNHTKEFEEKTVRLADSEERSLSERQVFLLDFASHNTKI